MNPIRSRVIYNFSDERKLKIKSNQPIEKVEKYFFTSHLLDKNNHVYSFKRPNHIIALCDKYKVTGYLLKNDSLFNVQNIY